MTGFETETPRTAQAAMHERRAVTADVWISRGPWTSESGSALADDVCRR